MADSDDYFTDDFILDDNALAILDQEEQKHALSTQIPVVRHVPPPPKRQKTETGWRPGLGNRRTETLDDLDDLPEISVRGDGSYGLHTRSAAIVPVTKIAAPPQPLLPQSRSNVSNRNPLNRTASSSSLSSQQRRSPSVNPPRPPQRHASSIASSRSASVAPVIQSQSSHQLSNQILPSSEPNAQVEELRRQMEELRKDNERIQSALKDAMNTRMAKEGEVSILRKSIEKTAQDHSAQVAKLRAAKEEADAKQVQMQKEIKEEMERLKTQYTFKQHELETSTRKLQWSARPKKTRTEAPPTPVNIPHQMRGWNAPIDSHTAGPSNYIQHETPRAPRFGTLPKESPKTARGRKQALTDSVKTSAKLPGFYNSFITSTPVRPSQARNTRAKKGDTGEFRDANWKGKERASLFGQPSQFARNGPPPPSPPSSPTRIRTRGDIDMRSDDAPVYAADEVDAGYDGDAGMGDVEMMDEMLSEELDEIEPPNLKEELHRIILTHTLPSSSLLTFQELMKAPSEPSMPATSTELYSKACSRILDVLATTLNYLDWEATLCTVAKSFTDMAHLLNTANLILPLTALFSLITNMTYSLPLFSSFLLSTSPTKDSPAKILVVLCDTIRNHISPSSVTVKAYPDNVIASLASTAIGLMVSLCWNIPTALEGQLALIPRSPQILSILLDPAQPLSLLSESARLLVLLSSYATLYRALLSFPDPDPSRPIDADAHKKFVRIPHIERLCSILVDTNLRGTEAQSLRDSVVAFFTMLSLAHSDALTILQESLTLIPSLVLYLTYLTTPFREDDIELMASPLKITSSIRAISRTLVLLNYLVFSTEPTSNLRQKLHHAPHRQFNGITHMFIVTFGILSYAEAPEWVDGDDKIELERMSEIARNLLDLVVEGPEGDSVYAAYQSEPDEGSITDDEEMEARHLDANEI